MGRPCKSEEEKLGPAIAFRLTIEDFEIYTRKVSASGMNRSEFFREHVLNNSTQVVARPKATVDAKRAIFLLQKASNNVNQLAHRANAEHLAGVLSEATFLSIVDQLERLNEHLLEQTREAKK